MVLVEGGTFQMGLSNNSYDIKKQGHRVTIKNFYMGKYEVTQKEWVDIMRNNPSDFEGDDLPVENVSWYEVVEYCNRLSLKEGLTPAYRGSRDDIVCDFNVTGYRLPTEAEWEYAAREGNKEYIFYDYSGGNNVDVVAWYKDNSGESTHPIGTKQPNRLGLYDMSGNVLEWCWDWYGSYTDRAQTNPVGPSGPTSLGTTRVVRSGSWSDYDRGVRSIDRNYKSPSTRNKNLGFRLVRSLTQ
jgi:formylglycine-generating enzyme required for sulfatase activity